jgi:hypothetical protein
LAVKDSRGIIRTVRIHVTASRGLYFAMPFFFLVPGFLFTIIGILCLIFTRAKKSEPEN